MYLIKSKNLSYARYLSFSVLQETYRRHSLSSILAYKTNLEENSSNQEHLQHLADKYKSNIYYNTIIENNRYPLGYKRTKARMAKSERFKQKMQYALECIQPVPISLKYLSKDSNKIMNEVELSQPQEPKDLASDQTNTLTQFPYSNNYSIKEKENIQESTVIMDDKVDTKEEIERRHREIRNWMTSYDNYENDIVEGDTGTEDILDINYGTPDPFSRISNVPCGGCGALLHCKDTAFPGYIPSEIFKNFWKRGGASLESIVCQRCYFLKEHNLALQVRVSSDDYPKVLASIKDTRALVVLMVDLMDFPCSIWPGIADIFGPRKPIMVVGNKVDLLPKDSNHFLHNIKAKLFDEMKLCGFGSSSILDVALISAKTGFGVEDLITSLESIWKYQGDVYLVGCTNVGKSSLFNCLLQSDYCKIQAADLIQRATTSQWPGTTLNLLKFPIMRPAGHRIHLRHQRLQQLKEISSHESKIRREQLKATNDAKYATLIGQIGQSYTIKGLTETDAGKDRFSTRGHSNASGKIRMGINERHPDYVSSRWCFDTPGVVQPDQIINMLTVDELMSTIPKEIIRPETFCVKPGTTLFIAGLARLDYLEGPTSIRLTVFRSHDLPMTICSTEEAGNIYEEFLGTEFFKVPINTGDRLSKWPGLQSSKPFVVTGIDWKTSSKDVVLSSAGWVAVTAGPNTDYKFQAWTPEKRGIYVRDCLLPLIVNLRGARRKFSVTYKPHKFI